MRFHEFFLIFLISIVILPFVSSDNHLEGFENDSVIKGVTGLQGAVGNLTDEDLREDYLRKEWTTVLEKTTFGPALLAFSSLLNRLDPFFMYALGMHYTLSWAFIAAVLIWFSLFYLVLGPFNTLFANNKLAAILSSFAVSCIVGSVGVIKAAVDLLAMIVKTWWLILIVIAVLVIILLVMKKLGKNFQKMIEKEKEKSAKVQTEEDRAILHVEAENSRRALKKE